MFRRSFLQIRHQTVVEFLVGSIMRTQEVIKCRTLFIHFLHVQRLPVQAANCVTVLKSLSSCETQTVSLWLATRRTLAALQGFTDVWLHKTNVSTGGKSCKQPLPSCRVDVRTNTQLPSHYTTSKECLLQSVSRGKPPPPCQSSRRLSRLLISDLITAWTPSPPSHQSRKVSGRGDSS